MVNLINIDNVSLLQGTTQVFEGISLGINSGEKIGIVGTNGGGKTSLLGLISGNIPPDSGRIATQRGTTIAYARQDIEYEPARKVEDILAAAVGDSVLLRSDPKIRSIIDGLSITSVFDRSVGQLSGGQRRRVSIAAALLQDADVLILDEPTNHLDLDGIAWLAQWLKNRTGAAVFVTHDRWFLDSVAQHTWEVADGRVFSYEGGYNDWIFARAERSRLASAAEEKRKNLARKELAWLRRGAPARTSKPKYRIAEAEALIAGVPEPRNTMELNKFATNRLGKVVIELTDATVQVGEKEIFSNITWNLAPGARIGVVGANGAGKSTLLKMLAGECELKNGKYKRGKTVQLGWLRQELDDLPENFSVVDSIEDVASRVTIGDKELTASQLAERLGFPPAVQRTEVGRLSGGQRRRLQFTRVLMANPNVLLLDEPTNDLDIDTLQQLEDVLDSWVGTLIVISHDRYLTERMCDDIYAIYGDGAVRHVPQGIDQYFAERQRYSHNHSARGKTASASADADSARTSRGKNDHRAHKELRKLETALEKLSVRKESLLQKMETISHEATQLMECAQELEQLNSQIDEYEMQWLELGEQLEQ